MLGLSTVKISAKSVTLIAQRSAGIGRGLRAMPHMHLTPKGYDLIGSLIFQAIVDHLNLKDI
jgi:hypothetical protein